MVGEYAQGESAPQIYALCGRGPRSSVRVMRHGASVSELASSPLPGNPSGIFTVKAAGGDQDEYIVLSFTDSTLVLSVGETVEEVSDSGFDLTSPTLACARLASGGIVQVRKYAGAGASEAKAKRRKGKRRRNSSKVENLKIR